MIAELIEVIDSRTPLHLRAHAPHPLDTIPTLCGRFLRAPTVTVVWMDPPRDMCVECLGMRALARRERTS